MHIFFGVMVLFVVQYKTSRRGPQDYLHIQRQMDRTGVQAMRRLKKVDIAV